MRFQTTPLVLLCYALSVLAFPFDHQEHRGTSLKSACHLGRATLPATVAKAFQRQPGEARHPSFVTIGVGIQNYTCASTGKYSSIGAVATLFDVSCLLESSIFNSVTLLASSLESQDPLTTKAVQDYAIGHHYFVLYNNTLSPRFDITHQNRVPDENYIIAKKLGNVASPDGPQNVDLLQLGEVSGRLAKTVYRVATALGQPPSNCSPGSPNISVKYAAQYWFYG